MSGKGHHINYHLLGSATILKVLCFALICFCSTIAKGQNEREKFYNLNQPNFDYRKYYFGFVVGLNQSDFIVNMKPDAASSYGLATLSNERLPGFNLGIVSAYRFTRNIRLKFIPTLSFQDRKLTYTFLGGPDSTITFEKIVEATFVELPIYVMFRTNRIGNFAAYAIGGGKYMLDMSSKKLEDLVADRDVLVRMKKQQFGVEFGGGAEFFLPYFKFGLEMKMCIGLGNVLINDNTRFTRPLNGLNTKGYILTLTFEG